MTGVTVAVTAPTSTPEDVVTAMVVKDGVGTPGAYADNVSEEVTGPAVELLGGEAITTGDAVMVETVIVGTAPEAVMAPTTTPLETDVTTGGGRMNVEDGEGVSAVVMALAAELLA